MISVVIKYITMIASGNVVIVAPIHGQTECRWWLTASAFGVFHLRTFQYLNLDIFLVPDTVLENKVL